MVALLDLIAAEGTHTTVTDVTLAHTDVPAALSPFSYVAPADLVLFLGITVLLLSSGVVESRRLGLMNRLAAAPVRRRSVVAALDRHEPLRRHRAVHRAADRRAPALRRALG